MFTPEISSVISAYNGDTSSVYLNSKVSRVNDKQDISDAEKTNSTSSSLDINDEVFISDEAKTLYETEKANNSSDVTTQEQSQMQTDTETEESTTVKEEFSDAEKQQITDLKNRDAEVKAHEQAHIAAASGISASAPSYEYEPGPDGKRYAVGGEVNISFTESGDPASDIQKAQAMKAAALAPAQPSSQDLSVARNADRMIAGYQEDIANQKTEETNDEEEAKTLNTTETETVEKTDNVNDANTKGTINNEPKTVLGDTKDDPQLASDEINNQIKVEQVAESTTNQVNSMPINNLLGIKI